MPLVIRKDVPNCDKEISFLSRLSAYVNFLVDVHPTHGAYVSINSASFFQGVFILPDGENKVEEKNDIENFERNRLRSPNKNKIYIGTTPTGSNCVLRCSDEKAVIQINETTTFPVIMTRNLLTHSSYTVFKFMDYHVNVHNGFLPAFSEIFKNYTESVVVNDSVIKHITYDNLLNLLVMVKNGGESFRKVLTDNLPYIDTWTILDTGSTDNTVDIIKEVFSQKEGNLYQEPFINFRDSRNRLLELAEKNEIKCAFNIMLDDTYVLTDKEPKNLRNFLSLVRGDDFADSYSLYITEKDIENTNKSDYNITYSSNRITKPEKKLRYKYTIHEIIENNTNVLIPKDVCTIVDYRTDYMRSRTAERKRKDLQDLFNELKENPDDPRSYYYIAETYLCLSELENERDDRSHLENAYIYYEKRASFQTGYDEERFDSLYKMAVIQDQTFKNWDKAMFYYTESCVLNPRRSEGLFMLGKHYFDIGSLKLAYMYFKEAFETGYPRNENMNIKVYIHDRIVPELLIPLCYTYKNWSLGKACAERLIQWYSVSSENGIEDKNKVFNKKDEYETWYTVFSLNEQLISDGKFSIASSPNVKNIAFVSPGGWDKWDGDTLETRGLGGSETFTVKYTETLARNKNYNVMVFCDCEAYKVYKDVHYIPLSNFCNVISGNTVHACFVNRYPIYLFPAVEKIPNVYLILHDLVLPSEMIPTSSNLKKVLCLSEWHVQHFLKFYPIFRGRVETVSYGLDMTSFPQKNLEPYSFIYPSFANRGLKNLLMMFPKIVEKYPNAKLNIFCDTKHRFVLQHSKGDALEIERMMEEQRSHIINHGWQPYNTLRNFWSKAHVFLYPCVFEETCCLTAYEAMASKTLIVCNDSGVLPETVSTRGLIVNGDARTEEWQALALEKLFSVLDGGIFDERKGRFRDRNDFLLEGYDWISKRDYTNVVRDFSKKYIEN